MMKSILPGFGAIFFCMNLMSCDPNDHSSGAPLISVTVSPVAGKTTQVFSFDLSESISGSARGNRIFSRWDWNGDGIWDTPLTRLEKYEHRFFAPGTWHARVEVVNLDGGSDMAEFPMQIERGYSPPKVNFAVDPPTGHIFTQFLLDATRTRDDEDSLNLLKFRWDFDGDGNWDTSLNDSVQIHHLYPEPGFYHPKVEVRDPSGLYAGATFSMNVGLDDPRLFASFRWIPDSVTYKTPVQFDASASVDLDHPERDLLYRWDWNNDWVWDTEWLRDPVVVYEFPEDVFVFVRLQVKSYRGLVNDTVTRIRLYHKNVAPTARFSISTLAGNVDTKFVINAWSSSDPESSPSDMSYRWDYNGDRQWDTDFSRVLVHDHFFSRPGVYQVIMQVKDPLGESDTCSKWIHVSSGKNVTGVYEDRRGYNYTTYGTVLIGKQWWFTRNMSVQEKKLYPHYFYNNEYNNYYDYGNLYELTTLNTICPSGWRVPSRADWEKLFANYPEEKLFEALMPGGESDFSAILGGMGVPDGPYSAVCHGINRFGYYWSTTQPMSAPINNWLVTFDVANRKVLQGFDSNIRKLYSVRCVKDAD